MINLTNTTFIIPVCIESDDRLKNAKTVLGYLNHHFNTNIIIHEIVNGETKLPFLSQYKNLSKRHIIEQSNLSSYHRTRQLNEMLNIVTTKVVVNYDIDVLLPVASYVKASRLIDTRKSHVVYPYGDGMFQKRIYNRGTLDIDYNLDNLKEGDFDYWNSKYGHCVFLNTKKYIQSGGENENFIAYAPEDVERYERFVKIGYKVNRVDDFVYHLEHSRTKFSEATHSDFNSNLKLYDKLKMMNKDETIQYYKTIDYLDKYKNFKK